MISPRPSRFYRAPTTPPQWNRWSLEHGFRIPSPLEDDFLFCEFPLRLIHASTKQVSSSKAFSPKCARQAGLKSVSGRALARATAAHPEDEGWFTRYILGGQHYCWILVRP